MAILQNKKLILELHILIMDFLKIDIFGLLLHKASKAISFSKLGSIRLDKEERNKMLKTIPRSSVIGFLIGLYFIGFGYLSTDEAKPLLLQNIEVQTINYEQNKIQSH